MTKARPGDRQITESARAARRNVTRQQALLWQSLRGAALGVKFRRQHPLEGFIVDFYAPAVSLGIELHGDDDPTEPADALGARLGALGGELLCFSNDDVEHRLDLVLSIVDQVIGVRVARHLADRATSPFVQ